MRVDTGAVHCTMPGMYTLLVVLLVLWLAWPVFRYALFWYSQHRAGSLAEIRERQGGLVWPMVRGMATGVVAECIVVATYFRFLPDRTEGGDGPVVLMVHGLFHNRSAWGVMKRRLRRSGFPNVHTYQYNCITKRFSHAVDGLGKKLDELLHRYPDREVFLVGHSQGGLVVRCVAGQAAYRDRLAGLVTLGAPHKGADMARVGMNRMSRDLIPGRETARMVDAVPDPECPRFSVYSLMDDFVYPLSMLRPDRPGWEETVVSPMNHVWMLYSGEVVCLVLAFLREHANSAE